MSSANTPRVMMVVRLYAPWVGGTERQAQKLARALLQRGLSVQIATGRWFRGTSRKEVIDGVPVFRHHTLWEFFGIRGLRKFGGYLYMLTLFAHLVARRRRYDVIHVHGLNYHTFVSVLAGRLLGKPVICKLANSGHGSDLLKMRESRQLAGARHMLARSLRCDRFVALSDAIADELVAAGVDRDRIVRIPNGVDTAPHAAPTQRTHDAPLRVLYLGRLHPNKGLDTLLRALAATGGPAGGLHARLVGEGPERSALERLRDELGLGSLVSLPGETSDVDAELDRAEVFVLPSRAEGISNALLEAMAAGLAVIASDVAGNAAVVTDGVDGLLFRIDDPAELARHLDTLREDEILRRELGRQAHKTVLTTYDFAIVAERYETLYRELAAVDTDDPLEGAT